MHCDGTLESIAFSLLHGLLVPFLSLFCLLLDGPPCTSFAALFALEFLFFVFLFGCKQLIEREREREIEREGER